MSEVTAPVQDREGSISVAPGLPLVEAIAVAHEAGRPSMVIGVMPDDHQRDLVVPIAKMVRLVERGRVEPPNLKPLWEVGFSDDLILAIETQHPIALERLRIEGSRARGDCNDLYVAALHDIAGLPWRELTGPLPGGFSFSDETAASRAGRRGRKMWRAIGAWPWFHAPEDPSSLRRWCSHGATGEWLAKSFKIWRTGRM